MQFHWTCSFLCSLCIFLYIYLYICVCVCCTVIAGGGAFFCYFVSLHFSTIFLFFHCIHPRFSISTSFFVVFPLCLPLNKRWCPLIQTPTFFRGALLAFCGFSDVECMVFNWIRLVYLVQGSLSICLRIEIHELNSISPFECLSFRLVDFSYWNVQIIMLNETNVKVMLYFQLFTDIVHLFQLILTDSF